MEFKKLFFAFQFLTLQWDSTHSDLLAQPLSFPHPNRRDFDFTVEASFRSSMLIYPPHSYYGTNQGPAQPESITKLVYYNESTGKYFTRPTDPDTKCGERSELAAGEVEAGVAGGRLILGDGTHRRLSVLNGSLSGPTLLLNQDSQVVIRLVNKLHMQGVSIHFHGIHQRGTWWMDGVSTVQQCPIPPGTTFVYRFKADKAGTYWYHGHFGSDRSEGLNGAFIVFPANESVDNPLQSQFIRLSNGTVVMPESQFVMSIQGWWIEPVTDSYFHLDTGTTKVMGFLDDPTNTRDCRYGNRTFDGTAPTPIPIQSILINGIGWHDMQQLKQNPWKIRLQTFEVTPNKAYLFRLINTGPELPYKVWVENHDMHVVAVDGRPIQDTVVDGLILMSGERYDFAIVTDRTPDSYFIRVETILVYNRFLNESVDSIFALARLNYKKSVADMGQKKSYPQKCTPDKRCRILNCPFKQFASRYHTDCVHLSELQSFHPTASPEVTQMPKSGGSTPNYQEHFINFALDDRANGYRYKYPSAPHYLPQTTDGGQVKPKEYSKPCNRLRCRMTGDCQCEYRLQLKVGNIVQLTFYNQGLGSDKLSGNAHPIHLHGHHFYLVKQVWGSYDPDSGFLVEGNKDLGCSDTAPCFEHSWSNAGWMRGNVPGMNHNNPIEKDTIIVPPGGYVVVRFKADNPGWWIIHCHILLHHTQGMAVGIVEGGQGDIHYPHPTNMPSCGYFDPQGSDSSQNTTAAQNQSPDLLVQYPSKLHAHKQLTSAQVSASNGFSTPTTIGLVLGAFVIGAVAGIVLVTLITKSNNNKTVCKSRRTYEGYETFSQSDSDGEQ